MTQKDFLNKIKSLKNDINVDSEFFDSNKSKFLNYVDSSFNKNQNLNFDIFSLFNKIKIPGFAFGASAVLVIFSGFTVSAAIKSLPGDPLYSFKISFENIRVAAAVNEQDYVNLQVQFTGNRIKELNQVLTSNNPNKLKVASDLVLKIDSDLSNIPNKVNSLNKDKKVLEKVALNIDSKIDQYSDELKNAREVANSSGMDDLSKNIDYAYIKGNHVSVKTLNIIVQNTPVQNLDDITKDIINRVEKKVDNIKEVVDYNVVNNAESAIINKSTTNSVDQNQDSLKSLENAENTTKTNEEAGESNFADQLTNIKEELNKLKVGLASADIAQVMNSIDKSLDNKSSNNVENEINNSNNTNTIKELDKSSTKDQINNTNNIETKKEEVKIQLNPSNNSGYGYGNEFEINSFWSEEER